MESKQQPGVTLAEENYRDLIIRYDQEHRALWCYLRASARPCYTPELLAELEHFNRTVDQHLREQNANSAHDSIRFLVFASRIPGIFNLGGDLALFLRLIRTGDREGLCRYTKSCIDLLHIGSQLPITTISLIQGDAFGGGFEGAIATRVLIAERRARMGLPEILFNLFPGMGAYSLLARRLDPTRAERLILSGRTFTAEELHEMGVVDVLADDEQGEKAVYAYMRKYNRAYNGYDSIHKVRQICHPLSYDELMRIGSIWVDAALQLTERDLRIMERIARSQEKLTVLRPTAIVKQLA